MSLKNRLLATAAVIAMAAAVIFSSVFLKNENKDQNENQEEKVSLSETKETLYFWYSDDSITHFINSAAVSFGEKEDVRVIPVLTSESEYLEAINQASLHSQQIPDAYLISNDSLEKAYLAGLASQIQDVENICTEEYFPKAALSAVEYQGKTVAYPLFYETSVLVYNETYLYEWAKQQALKELTGTMTEEEDTGMEEVVNIEEANVDEAALAAKTEEYFINGIPQTVDDILSIAYTFDTPDGIEGIMKWDVSDIFYNYWIVGNYITVGGDTGDNPENIAIYNAETIQCLEVYKALNQFFFIEPDTVTYDAVVQDFIDGKIMFTIGTTDVVKRLEDAKTEGTFTYDYGVAVMPAVSEELGSRSLSVTNAIAINGYSEKKELANEFAAYLVNEYAEGLYERSGRVSANRNVNTENGALQIFLTEYEKSASLPKMMETGNFWLQLEILFSKVWNGEDVTSLVQELDKQIALQVKGSE